jgi:hypothetical protein
MANTPITPADLPAGWTVELSQDRCPYTGRVQTGSGCITVETRFEPGDTAAYIEAERTANELVRMAHVVAYGSTWGTDSASVGGHAGLTGGYMRLSKSGVGARWLAATAKALGITVEESRR